MIMVACLLQRFNGKFVSKFHLVSDFNQIFFLSKLIIIYYFNRMVDDAEKFKQEDEKQRQRIAARNGLETYCLNMQSTVEDARLDNKINKSDKNSIMDKVNEVIEWLDRTQIGDEDEYKHKQKEIEQVCNPIMAKMYRE